MNTNTSFDATIQDQVDLKFPREYPAELEKLEQQEREDRINHGVDPILMGKHYRVQDELVSTTGTSSQLMTQATDALSKAKIAVVDSMPSKEQLVHAKDVVVDSMPSREQMVQAKNTVVDSMPSKEQVVHAKDVVVGTASTITENIMNKASEYLEVAKEKLGMVDPSTLSVTVMEEKERARRMSEGGVDPMTDARKHRVEAELLETVKSTN